MSLLLVACTALFLAGSAQAVHEFSLQLDGDVSTHAYTASNPPDDWGANTCNVADTTPPATCATGITGQTDLAHSIFKVSRNAAGTTESVDPNPLTVGKDKAFDSVSFQRDFQSNATCPTTSAIGLNSTSTNHCTGDDTTYATGSKDTLGIGNGGWQCNHDNNVNDKVDINNAYVASFWTGGSAGNGDHILYAGIEKQKNNGTNDIGVWFLQGTASCSSASHANWSGGHLNGDVLVVSEFSNGGGVSTVKTFTWRASTDPASPFFGDGGCIDSRPGHFNPRVDGGCNGLQSGGGGDCKSASVNDTTCATTNANATTGGAASPYKGTVSTPWLASDATLGIGNNNVVAPDYIEMGIDVTKLFAGTGEAAPSCFNTGVPDTRSSPSVTATLFDFVANQIGECQTAVKTTPVDAADHTAGPATSIPAAPADADVAVQDKATITVSGVPSFSGSIAWHLCGRTDPSSTQLCDGTTGNVGVDLGTTSATTNGDYFSPVAHITAAGRYCFRAEFSSTTNGVPPGSDSSSSECFTIAPRTPTLTTNATAAVETGTALNDVAHLGNTAKEPGTGGPTGASPTGSIGTPSNPVTLGGLAKGSITFTLYSAVTGNHCGTAIGSSTVAVSGNGDYNANDKNATNVTGTFSPGPGTYYWKASYTGDLPNTTAKASACDDANESSTVVDARISIAPNGVNEVNSNHTFTVTVQQNDGGGFVAAPGASVTVTLIDAGGAMDVPAGPLTGTTDANGQFTVTFTSSSAGTVTGHASATLTVDGFSMSRSTNGLSGNSGDAVKRFVNANVSISPPTAVNEVNHEHVFTITTHAFPAGTAATLTSITPSLSPTPDLENISSCDTPVLSNGGTTATCTVKIKSSTAGLFTLNATAVWHFADADANANPAAVDVTRDTDPATTNIGAGPGGSGPATKLFVDARISIAPNGVNEVNSNHTFRVTVQQNDGGGFVAAPGASVTVTLIDAGGAVDNATPATLTGITDANGQFTVTFTSASAGTVTGRAAADLTVDTVPLHRETDGSSGNSGGVVKRFVDANVTINPPTSTNEVGPTHPHTFTIVSNAFPAGSTPTLTYIHPSVSPAPTTISDTCTNPVMSNGGNTATCTVTITSNVAGTYTANAEAKWNFADSDPGATPPSVDVIRSTAAGGNAGPGGSGPATKRFVDAYITIGPAEKTNSVGQAHIDTVKVFVDNGNHLPGINVWENAPDGTIVTITLTDDPSDPGATPVVIPLGDVCGTLGTSAGACTITFTSGTAGTVIAHASVDVVAGGPVDGKTLHRETDGNAPNSGNAIKHFKAGSIAWTKNDDAGRRLPGATFRLCQISTYNVATGNFDPLQSYPPGDCQSVVDNSPPDEDPVGGQFLVSGLPLGQYTVQETQAPPGYVLDGSTKGAALTPQNSDTVQVVQGDPFVNTRPVLKITGFSYDNAPDGLPQPDGIFKGVVTYTVKLHNYGTADASDLTGSALSVSNASPNAGLICDAPLSFVGDSVAVNGELTKTLTCHYDHPNGNVITADLNVQYTTNGVTRIASGSPATISFTVNPN